MLTQGQKEFLFSQFKNPDRQLLVQFLAEVGVVGYNPTLQGATVGGVFFTDILAARDAALANETIYLGAGTYPELDLLAGTPNGVGYHGGNDVFLTGTLGASARAIFDTSTIATPANGYTGAITGFMTLSKPTDASFVGPVFTNNVNDLFYLEARSIQGNGNIAIWMEAGSLTSKIFERIDSQGADGVFINNASTQLNLDVPVIFDPTAPAIQIGDGATGIINCSEVGGTTATPVLVFGINSVLILNFEIIKTGDAPALSLDATSAPCFLTGLTIENDSLQALMSDGNVTIDCRNMTNLGNGQVMTQPAANADIRILDCYIESRGDIEAILFNTATAKLELDNVRVSNLNAAGASAHAIKKETAGILILQNIILLAGGGDSINAGAATNVLVYQGVANKAVNINVTEQVNNLTIDVLVQ